MRKQKKTTKISDNTGTLAYLCITALFINMNRLGVVLLVLGFLFVSSMVACAADTFTFDYSNLEVTRYNLSLSNMVRNLYYTISYPGKKISSDESSEFAGTYNREFLAIGTEYIELYWDVNRTNPSEGVYNYDTLDSSIDDVLSMGFKPHIRYGRPPGGLTTERMR